MLTNCASGPYVGVPLGHTASIVLLLILCRHDGGKAMILKINGKVMCTSNAVYGKGGDIAGEKILYMSFCGQNYPIKKGDVVTLTSVYDLKTHPLYVSSFSLGFMIAKTSLGDLVRSITQWEWRMSWGCSILPWPLMELIPRHKVFLGCI